MQGNWMIYAARTLAVVWAVFWLWFGIASGIGEQEGFTNALVHIIVPGGIAILTALAAWRWPMTGGILLVV